MGIPVVVQIEVVFYGEHLVLTKIMTLLEGVVHLQAVEAGGEVSRKGRELTALDHAGAFKASCGFVHHLKFAGTIV